jgi:hypothetical protein
MIISNIVIIILIFAWGLFGIEAVFKRQHNLAKKEIVFLQYLYVYHLLISLFFSYYVLKDGGDAKAYWFLSSRFSTDIGWTEYYRIGTYFMLFITYPLVKILEVNFYVGGLLFATLGFSSFIYLYVIVRKFIKKPIILWSINVFPFILFLPNLHFWTAGIGKDALTTFAIMLFYYAFFDYKRKWGWGLLSIVLMYHIRPHIVLFLLASSTLALLIDGRLKLSIKILLALIMMTSVAFMFDRVLAFLKLDEVTSESVTQFADIRSANLGKSSGSAVDMSGYPFPFKILTFLYRPLFFDYNGIMSLFASFENLVLLIISTLLLRLKPLLAFKQAPVQIKSILIFFVVSTVAFSMTLSNLGIILRQKTPIILCLLIFIFWCFGYRRYLQGKSQSNKIAHAQKFGKCEQ